ncbi:hypothetical protein ABT097_28180 [Streptomyces sp. NPDC002225]|uniref:hypothetical protein n=1 Tax=Streptomyces sp. NPDC002225 TaxID=3154413 RepID=UPI00331EE73F
MNAHPKAATPMVIPEDTYRVEDYVLYRDPEKFWTGQAGHTTVCRVTAIVRFSSGERRYALSRLDGRGVIGQARARYMRLLPSADVMHDIDTAPLTAGTGVADMTAAAVAWLAAQATTASGRPELPRD